PLEEVFQAADELKVVIGNAEDLLWAEQCAARAGKSCRLYLQPEWSRFAEAVRLITEYVKAHPQWKVSLQTHKFMEIP
ncbi:MAG: 7-carboxy-7-deazaguanine synthase QueE, partial [Alistipes inops]